MRGCEDAQASMLCVLPHLRHAPCMPKPMESSVVLLVVLAVLPILRSDVVLLPEVPIPLPAPASGAALLPAAAGALLLLSPLPWLPVLF